MLHRHSVSLLTVLTATIFLIACKDDKTEQGGREPSFALRTTVDLKDIPLVRLDSAIVGFTDLNKKEQNSFIEENRDLLWGYEQIVDAGELPVDEITVLGWATSDVAQMAAPEVAKAFPDLDDLSHKLGIIVETAKQNNLKLPFRRYVTVTWANPKSIINFDSINVTYIALNHYLGARHPFYEGFSENVRALKEPNMLPVDIAEAVTANSYPYTPATDNVLSRLLYDGVMAVVKESMVPDATLPQILGFMPKDMPRIEKLEGQTWERLLNNNMLYSSDDAVISNLFELRPYSTLIGGDAPGRVVRYIGYRIVKAYLREHPETTLLELLSPDFYGDGTRVLRDSKYNPA